MACCSGRDAHSCNAAEQLSLAMKPIAFLVNRAGNDGTTWQTLWLKQAVKQHLGIDGQMFQLERGAGTIPMEAEAASWGHSIAMANRYTDFGAYQAVYHIKSGEDDGWRPINSQYWVHAVFNPYQWHGDRYVAISEWLGERGDIPHVNHIVKKPQIRFDFRGANHIPDDATLIGRIGGPHGFDASPAMPGLIRALNARDDLYAILVGTGLEYQWKHPRLLLVDQIHDQLKKWEFISSCDVMLHARHRGETFGVSVGEFAVCGAQIVTYANPEEQAHFALLDPRGKIHGYSNEEDVFDILKKIDKRNVGGVTRYHLCTSEAAAIQFEEAFL